MVRRPKKGSRTGQCQHLVERIERDIGTGALPAGGWLKQTDLEQRYKCSRLLIRQALDQLAVVGTVDHAPNRGYQVPEFDATRIANISEVRAALEVAAVDDVVAQADEALLARLAAHADSFRAATESGTFLDRIDANTRFHAEFMSCCRNAELVRVAMTYRAKLPLAVQEMKNTPDLMAKSAQEHFAMIEALRARDLSGLKAILYSHIMGIAAPSAAKRK